VYDVVHDDLPQGSKLLAIGSVEVTERWHWELVAEGEGIHWPEIDEDLSARGFFVGPPAPGARARKS